MPTAMARTERPGTVIHDYDDTPHQVFSAARLGIPALDEPLVRVLVQLLDPRAKEDGPIARQFWTASIWSARCFAAAADTLSRRRAAA